LNVLVTGSAGFLGKALIKKFRDKPEIDEILGVDILPSEDTVVCDIRDYAKLEKVCEGLKPSVIIHVAAQAYIPKSFEDPIEDATINIVGTINVLRLALKYGSDLIFTSSASVYGNPKFLPISEEHPTNPTSPYGLSKLTGEKYIQLLYPFKSTILRLSSVYGIQEGVRHGPVNSIVYNVVRHGCCYVTGDGCIPQGYQILTSEGMKNIEQIKPNDLVMGHDGKFHKVTKKFKRKHKGFLVRLHFHRLNLSVDFTPNHPLLVIKTFECGKNKKCKPYFIGKDCYERCKRAKIWGWTPKWIKAEDIQKNDLILVPRPKTNDLVEWVKLPKYIYHHNCVKLPEYVKLTPEFGELCGLYIAEGSTSLRSNLIEFAFGLHEEKLVDKVEKITKNLFGLEVSVKERDAYKVRIFSRNLMLTFREWFGENAWKKKIPYWMFYGSNGFVASLLKGMFEGDGSCLNVSKTCESGVYSYTTVSRTLAFQTFLLLSKLGIVASIIPFFSNNSFGKRRKYRIQVSGKDASILQSLIRWKEIKHGKLRKWSLVLNEYIGLEVANKEFIPFDGEVFNLEVEECNSYICEGISAHNSQTRDFIHVSDVVSAIELVLDKGIRGIFNVGTGEEHSINDIVKLVEECLGRRFKVEYKPERPGEIRRNLLDISRLKAEGFKPQKKLKEGIKEIIDFEILNIKQSKNSEG